MYFRRFTHPCLFAQRRARAEQAEGRARGRVDSLSDSFVDSLLHLGHQESPRKNNGVSRRRLPQEQVRRLQRDMMESDVTSGMRRRCNLDVSKDGDGEHLIADEADDGGELAQAADPV